MLWIVLVLAIGVVVVTIFMIREAEVGARLARLLAVALASFAFYSPAALFEDFKILPLLVKNFSSHAPLVVFMIAVVAVVVFCTVDLIVHRREEIVGLKDAGTKFAIIGVAGVVARLCAGYLF